MISVWKRFAHICMHMFGYLFIFAVYDAVTPCPVFDCKIFLCHITFSFSEVWAFFPVKSSPPVQSVRQSVSLVFSLLFWAVFTFPDSSVPHHQLSEVTAHILGLQRGLAHWKRAAKHTHTHNLNPPCTPCSHSLSLSLSHTYIYTHTDLFAPVLIHKRICSSSLLVLWGHQWGAMVIRWEGAPEHASHATACTLSLLPDEKQTAADTYRECSAAQKMNGSREPQLDISARRGLQLQQKPEASPHCGAL